MRQTLRRLTHATTAAMFVVSLIGTLAPAPAQAFSGADFRADRIIDDHIFFDPNTLGAGDIQGFLNSKVPSCDTWGQQPYGGGTRASYSASNGVSTPFTCLKDYQQNIPGRAPDAYCQGTIGGGTKSAAQIIKDVSNACLVSPRVLLVLLQKEQALVTDDWPWPKQYEKATGYACPDSAPCDAEFAGFFNQVYYAARQYRRYAAQPNSFGHKAGRSNFVRYHPNASCGGTDVFIQNQATAGLYNYSPYQPNGPALANLYGTGDGCSAYGNRNFWRLYSDWFGSPVSGVCYNGAPGVSTGVTFYKADTPRVDVPNLQIYSGASTNCVEAHVWNSGFMNWKGHFATNLPSISTPESQIVYGDLEGDGRDYGILYGLQHTSSGKVEAHIWNRGNMSYWLAHTESNLPAVDPANNKIMMADVTGDGKDESILVTYRGTASGRVELHGWGPGMKTWNFHTVTNLPSIDPANMDIKFGDIDGDGRDDPMVVAYRGTGSGMVELHIWNPGEWSWREHIASNLPAIDPANAQVEIIDIDGDGRDDPTLVSTKGTASGRIEFHVWYPSMSTWRGHFASNQTTL